MKLKTTSSFAFACLLKLARESFGAKRLLDAGTHRSSARPLPAALALAAAFALVQPAVATNYTWNVEGGNWSTPTSWTINTGVGGPTATDTVVFATAGSSSSSTMVSSIADLGFAGTIAGLTYNSTTSIVYNVTQIPSGQTLLVTGPVLVGGQNGTNIVTQAFMTGAGGFVAQGSTFTVQNYGSVSNPNSAANLNLTNLSFFVYSNAVGTMSLGDNPGSFTRLCGNLLLAATSNSITASNLNIGTSTSAQAGPLCTLVLGAGTNLINAANFNIANQKNIATVSFVAPSGSLRIRGVSGANTDRANITIGNRNVTGTGTTTGNMLLNGSYVDIKAATLTIGADPDGSTVNVGVGVLQFDTGTVDATTILMAAATATNGTADGTLTVGPNGTLIIGGGGLSLFNQSTAGTAAGTLNISNGTVICNGSITEGNDGSTAPGSTIGNGTINFINGGFLGLAAGSVVGTPTLPIDNFNLVNNSTLDFNLPSVTETNIVVDSLTWPNNDTLLTITIGGLPVGATNGAVIPLISFASMSGGSFNAPTLSLPVGVTGTLSLIGNTICLTITGGGNNSSGGGGSNPGIGGQNQLANPGLELGTPGWTMVHASSFNNTPVITVGPTTKYDNSSSGACGADPVAELVTSHTGTNVGNMYGQFTGALNISSWSQTVPTIAGSTFTGGAYTYVSHEDMITGKNAFHYQVDFLNGSGTLLASYESFVISNLICGEMSPFTQDTWNFLAVTNEMQVITGTNTGVAVSNISSGILTAPPQTASVRFSVIFTQQSDNAGGSVYYDDANLGLLSGPTPPTISVAAPSLITFCTNQYLTCSATSSVTTISSMQVVATTTTLGSPFSTTLTNTIGSSLAVAGLGTPVATASFTLATNVIYTSVIVKATDANGVTVASVPISLDTLTPDLVIEASDFNYSGGQFMDTPANGGLALYTNQVGEAGIDENKAVRTATQSYYRPNDAVIIQAASPGSGNPPSGTEQKFVTALAEGDTNDIEVEVGYNSVGDWLNYTRTYGPGGSAPAGTYNIYCYLATSGSGIESALSLVTSDPTQPNQTTNFLGYFGTAAFTNSSYNSFVYLPLVDQYGNPVTVGLTNQETLKVTVLGNPNLGFYMLVPVQPVLTPALLYVSPAGGSLFQNTNELSFGIGPANGASVDTNGISLILNGVNVTSGLTFSESGGNLFANYTLQTNTTYTVVINATNLDGLSTTYSNSFDTFDPNAYQWEAVDYDFSTNNGSGWVSGLYIDNPVPTADTTSPSTGTLATNSYYAYPTDFTPGADTLAGLGAVALQGVDINFPDTQTGANAAYRADGVGSMEATDYLRPKFAAAQQEFGDSKICPFNIGYFDDGNWMNYTRDYPTNNFNVWARLAGGGGAFSGTTLSLVTSGVGTSNQVTTVLGSFADANPAGWQVYHWIPLLDTNGNQVVVPLGGKATLRLTSGNNLNPEFLMLTPAVAEASSFALSAAVTGNTIQISIPTESGHNYTLYYTASLSPVNWTPVGSAITGDGTVHVITQPSTGGQGYYQVVAQ